MPHLLLSGAPAHQFTNEERSRGGKAEKYNALKHGRYATKLSQAYVCPSCFTPVPGGVLSEQDAIVAKLASKEALYHEIKCTIYEMRKLLEEEPESARRFAMLSKLNEQLIKIWEKQEEKEAPPEDTITLREVMDRIVALDECRRAT